MKFKIFFSFLLISCPLIAMQPYQWIRNVTPQVQAELKAEDAERATQELAQLGSKIYKTKAYASNEAKLVAQIKPLLNRGANPNVIYLDLKDSCLSGSLLSKAIPNYPEIVELLLQAGADSNINVSQLSEAPIIFDAICGDSPPIVKCLLAHKADPNAKSTLGTPLTYAIHYNKNPVIVDLLLNYHADRNLDIPFSPLLEAINAKNIYIIQLLLRAGANPDAIYLRNSLRQSVLNRFIASTGNERALYKRMLDIIDMYSSRQKGKIL